MRPLEEQTILITGSTEGLGREVATRLSGTGAHVLVHGRSEERGQAAIEGISARSGDGRLSLHIADLSSLEEVRGLATAVEGREQRLDVLVNNAGIALRGNERQLSADGHELTFAVNYLSHFLLTALLLPILLRSGPARIVNVSSIGQAPVDFDDVMLERGYEPFRAYAQSKLAQIMFTIELAERFDPAEITVNALHPATLMDTKLVRETFGRPRSTVEEGTEATLRLVASPGLEGVSGLFFDGQRESAAHPQAYDLEARRRLWALSEALCGIE